MKTVKVYCENTGSYHEVGIYTTLKDLSDTIYPRTEASLPVLAALVDNKLKSLDYRNINPHKIRFIGYDHPDGRRTYIRSLCFVLQNVVREMFPDKVLAIDYSLTDDQIQCIADKMRKMIEGDLPFSKSMLGLDECVRLFSANHQHEKVNLFKTLGHYYNDVYFLDGQADTFYGPLAVSTGVLKTFDLIGFNEGFLLQYPMDGCPDKVLPMKRQSKLAKALEEHSDWCSIMGVRGIGKLNAKVLSGDIIDLINLSEALHESMLTLLIRYMHAGELPR